MPTPPPTPALVELAEVLGEDNVRTLARTFLKDFPVSLQILSTAERKERHRAAHSMKSNSRLMGAMELSQRMAGIEKRLETPDGGEVTPADLTTIQAEFDAVAGPLRAFVGP